MKKYITEIRKIGINGEGIGYIDRNIVFIPGTFIDEEVEFEVIKDTPTYKTGKLLRIIKSSPFRKKSICRQNKVCLGCPLIELDYEKQLEAKKEILIESIKKYANIKYLPTIEMIGSKDTDHNQNMIKLPVTYFKNRIALGIYQRETKFLTLMNDCSRQDQLLNQFILELEELLNKNKIRSYDEKFKKGLRFVLARVINDEIQVSFITGIDRLPNAIIESISKMNHVASIFVSINTKKRQDFIAEKFEKKFGKSRLEINHENSKFVIGPTSSFPSNTQLAFSMVDVAKKMLLGKENLSLLEINCGIGYFGLSLKDQLKSIKGIDGLKGNIHDAKDNAHIARYEDVSYEKGDIDEILPMITKNKQFDVSIIHQEESGLSNDVVESMIRGKIENIIYITKTISSMAKDIALLEKYYKIEKVVGIDMVPFSANLVCMAQFKRK